MQSGALLTADEDAHRLVGRAEQTLGSVGCKRLGRAEPLVDGHQWLLALLRSRLAHLGDLRVGGAEVPDLVPSHARPSAELVEEALDLLLELAPQGGLGLRVEILLELDDRTNHDPYRARRQRIDADADGADFFDRRAGLVELDGQQIDVTD